MSNTIWESVITKEFLEEEYVKNKKGCYAIAKMVGCDPSTIIIYCDKLGIPIRTRLKRDLSGEKFGNLTVISRISKGFWKCACICGEYINASSHDLTHVRRTSCGCTKGNTLWRGYGDISGNFFGKIKKSARERKLEFSITVGEIWNLYLKQDKKCALTRCRNISKSSLW